MSSETIIRVAVSAPLLVVFAVMFVACAMSAWWIVMRSGAAKVTDDQRHAALFALLMSAALATVSGFAAATIMQLIT